MASQSFSTNPTKVFYKSGDSYHRQPLPAARAQVERQWRRPDTSLPGGRYQLVDFISFFVLFVVVAVFFVVFLFFLFFIFFLILVSIYLDVRESTSTCVISWVYSSLKTSFLGFDATHRQNFVSRVAWDQSRVSQGSLAQVSARASPKNTKHKNNHLVTLTIASLSL